MTENETDDHKLKVNFFYGNPGVENKESSSCRGNLFLNCEYGDAAHNASSITPVVAIVDVPPDQVPNGIMNLIRSYWSMLNHIRVVISNLSADDDSLAVRSETVHSSTEQAYTVLLLVKNIDNAIYMVKHLHDRPFTSLQMNIRATVYHVTRIEDEKNVEIQLEKLFPSIHLLNPCPVCLETLTHTTIRSSSPSFQGLVKTNLPETRNVVFTTACTHSFHLDCFVKCQNSPCPLCRFDHSTLNDSLSSSCHVCGSNNHLYICLICGIVSCQAHDTLSEANLENTHTVNHISSPTQQNHHQHQSLDNETRILGHASFHYQQSLHAYALEVESQHVFDFAGNGYVHRLIQNKEDGKLVEVTDPFNAFQDRAYTPGLSNEQQEEVVHVKLERLAYRYQSMLRNFMDEQRHYYQSIIYDLKRQLEESKSKAIPSETNKNILNKNIHKQLSVLKQERHQLQQRHDTLRKKHTKLMEDLAFIIDFNKSLETNQESLRRQITQAQQERKDIDDLLSNRLPPLQQKLVQLMSQLED